MLRSEQNPEERPGLVEGPTSYQTPVNAFSARCGMCGAIRFVDEATLRAICVAAEMGLDNPFKCTDCEEEYDELA
jgi:hypothetical protein